MATQEIEKAAKAEIKKRNKTEKQRIAEYKAKIMVSMEDEIKVRFQNIESPGFNCEFTYQGIKSFNLLDGYEYKLPKVVANHLNNITLPKYAWQLDPETQLQKCVVVGKLNRFSCIPTSM